MLTSADIHGAYIHIWLTDNVHSPGGITSKAFIDLFLAINILSFLIGTSSSSEVGQAVT